MKGIIPEVMVVTSDKRSPIVFLKLAHSDNEDPENINLLNEVAHQCLQNGVAIVSTGRHLLESMHETSPAIRLTISAVHTKEDIDKCLTILEAAVNNAKVR